MDNFFSADQNTVIISKRAQMHSHTYVCVRAHVHTHAYTPASHDLVSTRSSLSSSSRISLGMLKNTAHTENNTPLLTILQSERREREQKSLISFCP